MGLNSGRQRSFGARSLKFEPAPDGRVGPEATLLKPPLDSSQAHCAILPTSSIGRQDPPEIQLAKPLDLSRAIQLVVTAAAADRTQTSGPLPGGPLISYARQQQPQPTGRLFRPRARRRDHLIH